MTMSHYSGKSFGSDSFGQYDKEEAREYKRCYHSHPELLLGGGKFIGGSCSSPVTLNADIYIGFDYGMRVVESSPWEPGVKSPMQFLYEIHDMHAPSNAGSFIRLIDWTALQLSEGKTVHAGCIGGHGRTGTFLAALWKVVKNESDAIRQVRAVYCQKAVESSAQTAFLAKHFGIKDAPAAKESGRASAHVAAWSPQKTPAKIGGKALPATAFATAQPAQQFKDAQLVFTPVKSTSCIWDAIF